MDSPLVNASLLSSPLRLSNAHLSAIDVANQFKRDGSICFVTACQRDSPEIDACVQEIASRLSGRWTVRWSYVPPAKMGLSLLASLTFACFEIQCDKADLVAGMLHKMLCANGTSSLSDLSNYGLLIDGATKKKPAPKNKDIVCHSFQHFPGVYYRFRYRRSRLATIPQCLAEFLTSIPQTCPHSVFTSSANARASAQELPHQPKASATLCEQVSMHAAASIWYAPYKSRHENLERYFLEYDPHCIATEVPVWAIGELPRFPSVTGHIDVLRVKEDRIEIWDYKPNATEERMAALQVQLYCEMLAQRTGLPLSQFSAGYFDETDVYRFEPALFCYL